MNTNSVTSNKIHSLLQKTIIPPSFFELYLNGCPEHMNKQLEALYKHLERNTPEKLYRFRKFSKNSVNALKEGKIYFTRADKFNDPYDCLLHIDEGKLINNIVKQISNKNLKHYIESGRYDELLKRNNINTDDFLNVILGKKEWFLNEIKSTFPKACDSLQKSTYITCFSESIKSPTMWSHYADYHYGFAIEYDFQPSFFYPSPYFSKDNSFYGYGWRSLLPVHYSKYRADASALVDWYTLCEMRKKSGNNTDASCYISDMLLKTKLCLEKSESWSYEKEWRLILTFEWPYSITNYRSSINYKASAVYLGSRMKERNKQQLINICKTQKIPVYQMKIDHLCKEYSMDYEQII